MQSIQTILDSQFLKRSVVPIAVFGVILIGLVYLFTNYQRQENRHAQQELTQQAFEEIAMQTALNINRQFTSNQNALHQLAQTLQILLKNKEKLNSNQDNWINTKGFFINKELLFDGNKTAIYATNIVSLDTSDYQYLSTLSYLGPSIKTSVDLDNDLINKAWINIGKFYNLSYPIIDPTKELSWTLDVTQYPFYYLADSEHNPDKQIVFSPLYKETWAIDSGELGAYLMPVYEDNLYIGVIGFTLTAEAIAHTITRLKLPFNAYAMLVDDDGYLIASSDNTRSYKTFNVNSFYELYQNKNHPNRHMMQISNTDRFKKKNIVHKQKIMGTSFTLIVCAQNSDVFRSANLLDQKALQLGALLLGVLILLYIFFIIFTKKSIKLLATNIIKSVQSALSFSSHMGQDLSLEPIQTDITEFQKLGDNLALTHQKLIDLINKDPQTGFFNLYQLKKDLENSEGESLMRIELGNYHSLFNLYGQDAIDTLIQTIKIELASFQDIKIYRIHENEFALLQCSQNIEVFSNIFSQVNKLSIQFNGVPISSHLYSGMAITYPLLEESGIALLRAQQHHIKTRPITCLESSDTKEKFISNMAWSVRVEKAFEEDLFIPYFQPIFEMSSNCITKFEALVRLKEGDEVLSPYLFLQAITDIGKDNELTRLMIDKVFKVAANFEHISFNINISFYDLRKHDFLSYIDTKTQEYGITPSNITFELLENATMDDSKQVIKAIASLKQRGFKIAIDDFGTGNSNFAHLMSMRVDYIKIDGQFIKNIIKDPNSVTITKTIAQFASLVGAQTVAEFVADESIMKRVRQLGIDYSQGYVISPPLPEEQLHFILEKDFSYVSK